MLSIPDSGQPRRAPVAPQTRNRVIYDWLGGVVPGGD